MVKSAEIKTNKWHGETNYLCPFCPHATTQGKDVMEAHILGAHANELRAAELEKMTAKVVENPAGVGAPDKQENK